VPANLENWKYRPRKDTIAVDPVLGRIAFPPRQLPKKGVRVSYQYGFSADLGGGEYRRQLSQPEGAELIPLLPQNRASARPIRWPSVALMAGSQR